MGDRPAIVYLGGFGRSGSTLVERVLGAVPGWCNVGELVDLARAVARTDERCGCGAPFSRCSFWIEVGRRAFGGWTPELLDRLVTLHRGAARQRHLPALVAAPGRVPAGLRDLRSAYTALYRAVAQVSGAEVIVDASKGPALGLALAGSDDLDVRLLNVVRDPRAVAWSWSRQVDRPHTMGEPGEMWRIGTRRSATQWAALQLEVAVMTRLSRVRSARLRYEDFVADPVTTLARATATLGLPVSASDLPVVGPGTVRLGSSHGLSGNPSRFRSGDVQLRVDAEWATAMPVTDRAVVTGITLPLLAAYRYPVLSGRSS